MGLTLVQRGSGRGPPPNPRIALVLAGGAVSGGAFKIGGLQALDEFLGGGKVTGLDVYVGLSAGAFLATSLAAGITPAEMTGALDGTSDRLSQLRPIDVYNPNLAELLGRPVSFGVRMAGYLPGLLVDLLSILPDLPSRVGTELGRLLNRPSYAHLESLLLRLIEEVAPKRRPPSLGSLLPSGLFDNAGLERWLARNLARVDRPNRFADLHRETGRRLYLTATDLDTAERVVFGPENDHGLTISEAVQASSSLPGFFRPARLNGVDYVDGGVRRTANIDVAIEHGADLVICYNPFRPFLYRSRPGSQERPRHLADRGARAVLNQVFRTLLHSRLVLSLQAYLRDEQFRGDIVVIEARETDEQFFDMNPFAFWKRSEAVRHGFESVQRTLRDNAGVLVPLFESYGLRSRPRSRAGQRGRKAGAGPGETVARGRRAWGGRSR